MMDKQSSDRETLFSYEETLGWSLLLVLAIILILIVSALVRA
jgi:hypothetical protein